jgi:DNA adenine methylase
MTGAGRTESSGHESGADIEMSGRSVFPYPGNKAKHAEWILRHVAEHDCYVEPFGGAGGVLANKPDSKIEVYNDRDADLVQFFDVLRERGAELADWLDDLPYAREKYEEWASKWYDGWRPDDEVRRAGVFFFLRATAFGAKYRYQGGFAISTSRNQAYTYQNQIERLRAFADRFRGQVVVENLDYRDVMEKWDSPDTLFYLDPPYADAKFRYRRGKDFDHHELADRLQNVEGRWIVSYSAPPSCIREVGETLVTRTTKYQMAAGHNGPAEEVNETLVLNYDPAEAEPFLNGQSELDQFCQEPMERNDD